MGCNGESRRGFRLKDAVRVDDAATRPDLRVRGRLTQTGHRGDAGIGPRESFGPLRLGPVAGFASLSRT